MAPIIDATVASSSTVFDTTHVVQFNLVALLPLKLQGNLNVSTWKAQLVMLLNGHQFMGHLDEVRSLSYALKVAGSPVNDDELIVKILSGLGPEYCEISALGLTADVCRSKSHNHFEAKVNFASGLQSSGNSWVLDSSATYHFTNEPHNLEEYTGMEEISMGDGKTIPITHTGSTLIHASKTDFKLSDTLCAPSIKNNLISIAKFCQDNLTSVEFFPFTFVVKDLHTLKSLVQGRNKNGLYEWLHLQSRTPFINLASTKAPLQLGHCRLGHPPLPFQILF
ncbi:hypothetical protein KY290_001236 [Solanum tuberosum]|uniref:Retrovirus-related Pol polyprotein from transposon TNT 1-94-like beta-barrel domain-containing protein n=1 Tax=Solanum tuberosum TaxID=4113 RepID=A0ABQ7WLQ3_SOLTU|nr:hypothetical protein KY290_001236 [Solanum tuberosum]